MLDVSRVHEPRPSETSGRRPTSGVVAAGSIAIVGAFAAGALGSTQPPLDDAGAPIESLRAHSLVVEDYDGDGLTDAQELVLGTFPFVADSDDDGFMDGEEVARQSDPRNLFSVPETEGISASIVARGEEDDLRLVLCVHEPAGEISDSILRLGALRSGRIVTVPLARVLGFSEVRELQGSFGSRVVTVEIPVQPAFVHSAGRATFFLAAGNATTQYYGSASKVDVTSTDGILLLQQIPVENQELHATQGGGSIRQPIPSGGGRSIPASWIPGAICFQRASVVGGAGAVVLHQIIEADCLPGWDSYCASDCVSSIGSTYETIDPAALIGG
ncbi:MAG: hypothetical protein AAGB93_06995 [Planctomycetota bacterium]